MKHRVSLSPGGRAGSGGLPSPDAATGESFAVANQKILQQDVSNRVDDTEVNHIESSLKSGKLLVIMPLFLLLGLGLSFTPCVLPMVPILSSIIVGGGTHVKRRRACVLSIVYAMGMAIVYTALGVAAGLAGEGLSAACAEGVGNCRHFLC